MHETARRRLARFTLNSNCAPYGAHLVHERWTFVVPGGIKNSRFYSKGLTLSNRIPERILLYSSPRVAETESMYVRRHLIDQRHT